MEVQISVAQTFYSLVSLQQIPVKREDDARKTFKLGNKETVRKTPVFNFSG